MPGWSLARDAPKRKKKQGWECPAPSVEDWEDYKKWKEEQGRKDELPAAPQVFLADSQLLFYQDPDVQLPWIHRLKCELPRRVGRLSGELPVKASYIGFGTEDDSDLYEVFKKAMAQIGVVLCRQIHNPPSRFELAHLEQSDLVLVGGGDRKRLWETLGTDLGTNAVAEHVKWRYLQGAVVVAVGTAMSLLGEKSWYSMGAGKIVPFTGWKIFPHVVAPEAEGEDLEDVVEQLGGPGVVILGIHSGGGMIFNKDGLVEPVRNMISEYRWDWPSSSVKQALLLGPPRGTGLICPLYAATKKREGEVGQDEEEVDAWAYALTQEEEHEEEQLMEHFDIHNAWLAVQQLDEVEALKQRGNESFKADKADLARLQYEQARVLLKSSACRWSELEKETQERLEGLSAPGLPSEKQRAQAELGRSRLKEDFRATGALTSLLLNLCACHLLLYEQDQERETQRRGQAALEPEAAQARDALVEGAVEQETTLVELRDNLAAAFRAANEALLLSAGRSAKAWYRRGCVFEKMRDPRNALRDFEEGLLRAPGDKGITKKRDEVREAAGTVAESMYYARHKELDEQERQLKMETRRGLLLRGSFGDPYVDEKGQFAVTQPLARLVEATVEEVEGRQRLVIDKIAVGSSEDVPYLHPQALWTWEFMVQKAVSLQVLQIEDVDLGAGPLEWLCKGLRSHAEVRTLRLQGVHLGSAGGKMLRNVVAQSRSLLQVALDNCALGDAGVAEVAEGLGDSPGQLEVLSLKHNMLTAKRVGKIADALCAADNSLGLSELDLGGNALAFEGARELGRLVASGAHRLRVLALQDCLIDLAGFWRLTGNLDDSRPLTTLDLRCNPIGRGTRRCWRSTMGPTIRCEVLLSDHPLKARKEAHIDSAELDTRGFPLPGRWA